MAPGGADDHSGGSGTARAWLATHSADRCIRIGEAYQASVPPYAPGRVSEARADVRLHIEHTPLTAPPAPPHIPSTRAAPAPRAPPPPPAADASAFEEEEHFHEDGAPKLPCGVGVGDFCLAEVALAGELRRFKSVLVATRRVHPALLVKFVGLADGTRDVLQMPAVNRSYVTRKQVTPWPAGDADGAAEARAQAAEAAGGEESRGSPADEGAAASATRERRALRARPAKPEIQLLTEAGGLHLHLDPRRHMKDYAGTGYKGVFDDYWPCGFKKYKPYVVTHDGKYNGRFATVEQAAVQYARLEMGLPPLKIEQENEHGVRNNKRRR
ncbi:hypothetical protein AB1Y20_011244 [Prymnesium parvum]|uniref:AP2/ERF domain-containing protein n=1 Tax=Prymnesium parvum TaxID=97485 RepID=A0AB34INR5_PRYPA